MAGSKYINDSYLTRQEHALLGGGTENVPSPYVPLILYKLPSSRSFVSSVNRVRQRCGYVESGITQSAFGLLHIARIKLQPLNMKGETCKDPVYLTPVINAEGIITFQENEELTDNIYRRMIEEFGKEIFLRERTYSVEGQARKEGDR